MLGLALSVGAGAFGAYGLAHMPDNVPWWVSLALGGVFTAGIAVAHLYQHRPGDGR
jgi:hypothetical protein